MIWLKMLLVLKYRVKTRAQHKLSQEALADLVGLHRTYVGSLERSERNVSLDNVERLAVALSVDIADLLSESPSERSVV